MTLNVNRFSRNIASFYIYFSKVTENIVVDSQGIPHVSVDTKERIGRAATGVDIQAVRSGRQWSDQQRRVDKNDQGRGTWNSNSYITMFTNIPNLNPYSAGVDFSRQNLTSADVRFWRLKSIPALQIFLMAVDT